MAFTFFFRDIQTLEMLAEHVIPFSEGRRAIYAWDAGCATGQEPYSLAIIFAERMGNAAFKSFRLVASDLDPEDQFLNHIRAGYYTEDEPSRIPDHLRDKYFCTPAEAAAAKKMGHRQIHESIRNSLQLLKNNLLELKPIRTDFSMIMCKNVLLHFSPEERIKVITMFHSALLPGGFFATENTQKMPAECHHLFEPLAHHVQMFRKREVPA